MKKNKKKKRGEEKKKKKKKPRSQIDFYGGNQFARHPPKKYFCIWVALEAHNSHCKK